MNCRGIESFPFVILISFLLVCFSIVAVFWQVNFFSSSVEKVNFFSSVGDLGRTIDFLKASFDLGSFLDFKFKVPEDFSVTFVNSSILVSNMSHSFIVPVLAVFNGTYKFSNGGYDLRLCYGICGNVSFSVKFY